MKMKKVFASVLTAVLSLTVLSGCGGDHSAGSADGAVSGEGSYKIGISQFAEHPSLDNCRKGFLAGLKEEGIAEGKIWKYCMTMRSPIPLCLLPSPAVISPKTWT